MNLAAILTLGFLLGMRHATDGDHVVAVSAIVSRERSLRAALPIGILWGIGHTVTVVIVGGAIVVFGLIVPPHVGLGLELCVAVMLLVLGAINLRRSLRTSDTTALGLVHVPGAGTTAHGHAPAGRVASMRPLLVGVVHGLAGSAAVALLVLGVIQSSLSALGYLLVFGVGTIAGMGLITLALAMPFAVAATRFQGLHRTLGIVTGVASMAFGAVLLYQVGFVDGFFSGDPRWSPH